MGRCSDTGHGRVRDRAHRRREGAWTRHTRVSTSLLGGSKDLEAGGRARQCERRRARHAEGRGSVRITSRQAEGQGSVSEGRGSVSVATRRIQVSNDAGAGPGIAFSWGNPTSPSLPSTAAPPR